MITFDLFKVFGPIYMENESIALLMGRAKTDNNVCV